jgi:transposase InsO family protein
MTQRASLTEAEKQNIQKMKASGMSLTGISIELSCSYQTVRKWWRNGKKGFKVRSRGRPKRGALSTYAVKLSEKAVEMKKTHPHWGAKKVRLELKADLLLEEEQLPSAARLSALVKERCPEAVQAHQARLLPPTDPKVYSVNQRWQMDAKEHIPLGTERANVQEIRDVYSGLMIASQAFASPHVDKGWQRLRREDHQNVLRQAFCQWGLPLEVQTDNDDAFAHHTDADFPSLFTLWLVGLSIQHIRSRPHRPTDQAQVERNHRTQGGFVWKDQSFTQLELLQQALDHSRQMYNEQYPSHSAHCHGRSPLSAFPTALFTGRPYHPDLEWDLFDLNRVDAFLTRQVWTRKVACNGTVNLGSNIYNISKPWVSQTIAARFVPDTRSFSFLTKEGNLIKTLPALDLGKEQIIGLIPLHMPLAVGFQFSLPFLGV